MQSIKDDWKRQLGSMALAVILAVGSATAFASPGGFPEQKEKKSKKAKAEAGEAVTETTESSEAASSEKKDKKKKKEESVEAEAGVATKAKKGGKAKEPAAASLAPTAKGQPLLWRGHADISQMNLFWGAGGESKAPKPPFTFVKEDVTGTNPKVKVTDANGVKWNVKFDEEVHAEVAASRIVWACGFGVEESYFVPAGKIIGVKGLGRAKNFVRADGSFTNAMFENRPDTVARRNIRWTWDSNPFVGSKELSGLAILNVLLNNWDAKIDNNNVLGIFGDENKVYDWYIQSDWGGTFGKMGGVFSHTKWSVSDYTKQAFITGVSNGKLQLNYTGKMSSALKTVPLEHARWFAGIIGQLSDDQLRDAFRAAGASDQEVSGFAAKVRQKINELQAAAGR